MRRYVLRVEKDLRTGKMLPDRAERVTSVDWSKNGHTLFFTTEDSVNKRSDKYWRHVLGSPSNDLLYFEKEAGTSTSAATGRPTRRDHRGVGGEDVGGVGAYLPADKPMSALKLLYPREAGHELDSDCDNGRFLLRTNKEQQELARRERAGLPIHRTGQT